MLTAGLRRLRNGEKLTLHAFKLSHHGSKGTLSPTLLDRLDCARFLISTDGSRHDHPDREAVARILTRTPGRAVALIGNYGSEEMLEWDIPALRSHFGYTIEVPANASDGVIRVSLS